MERNYLHDTALSATLLAAATTDRKIPDHIMGKVTPAAWADFALNGTIPGFYGDKKTTYMRRLAFTHVAEHWIADPDANDLGTILHLGLKSRDPSVAQGALHGIRIALNPAIGMKPRIQPAQPERRGALQAMKTTLLARKVGAAPVHQEAADAIIEKLDGMLGIATSVSHRPSRSLRTDQLTLGI